MGSAVMFAAAPIKECQASSIADLKAFLAEQTEPLVIRDLCVDWPQVMAAKQGSKNALDYLLGLANNASVRSFSSQAIHQGRYFYNADFSGLNFSQHADNLVSVLQKLARSITQTDSDSLYMGSTAVEYCAPGFSVKNPLTVTDYNCLTSLWVGNHSQIAAHYDNADNLACVAAGERTFTLLPTDQVNNLYVGPLEFTPAGQAVSLVDFNNPDFNRFPRFKEAIAKTQSATLGPGDAIYIPALWWHQVSATSPFNVLVNYWWRQAPEYLANPFDAMLHSMLAIKDLPSEHKQKWQQLFNHYVFADDVDLASHVAEPAQGILADIDELTARRIRQLLLQKLNR
ncbi:cupin-like domain-containing protein [Pseudoalteromonas sp. GB43]|tara:strand:+ start:37 stop:1062 length:1026 start_codon:yes stop_codon:yes gene_type:complete